MHWMTRGLLLPVLFASCYCVSPAAEQTLSENLQPFQPFIGKTWKGKFENASNERPVYDIARWERALNGKAVRILHSVNDGAYGGESITMWDAQKKKLVYFYFTTAGFFTQGTTVVEGNKLLNHEYVTGKANGVTEVKSEQEILPDGSMRTVAKYLKEGKWVDGHTIHYVEAPNAEVVFK